MHNDILPGRRPAQAPSPSPSDTSAPLRNEPGNQNTSAAEPTPTFDVPAKAAVAAPLVDGGETVVNPTPAKQHRWPLSKKKTIIALVILLVLLSGGITAFALTRPAHPAAMVKQAAVKPKAVTTTPVALTVPSTLSGLPVAPAVNQRPVTAVMVENSTFARPQSGLDQASVVFEAIAEAGITRFMAVYQDTQPNYIGPVRSARPYYEEWALGFDASYAHVGGSPEALTDIKSWNVRDLNQFYNGAAYQRITSRDAPHNVYTSIAALNSLETSKGYGTSTFTGFLRKADAPSKTPTATSIDFNFSNSTYAAHYDYDAATNSYKRSEGGTPHMELSSTGTLTQITPHVVIAMVMPYSLEADNYHSVYQNIGTGAAYVFQDGTVTVGTWTKTSGSSQIVFKTSAGQPLALNAGQTWIGALGSSGDITYR
jgi:hypothetical protein